MKRMSNILKYAASAWLLLLAAGCRQDVVEQPVPEPDRERLPASLSLTVNASDIYRATIDSDTRNNLVDPDGNASGWSDEQKLADGRTIRRLTVMLVDCASREMVAYRHIIYDGSYAGQTPIHVPLLRNDDAPEGGNGFIGDDGKVDVGLPSSDRVRLTFDYDHPLHGEVERLKHGKYELIAVANYASLPKKNSGGTSHPAVENENEFVQQIHTLIHKFYGDYALEKDEELRDEEFLRIMGKGIANFDTEKSGFYDYVLEVAPGTDIEKPYIRKKLDELPLFTVGYIDLQPGENVLSEPIPLYRTYSRVRIEVKNYSEKPLSVNHLGFSNNFSKDRTYFCRMPGASDIFDGLDYEAGAPVVSYGESIIAFPYYNTSIPGETLVAGRDDYLIVADNTDPRKVGKAQSSIEKGQTAAIFDAYISPSRADGEKYWYEIEVEYKGADGYISCSIDEKVSPISTRDDFADKYFMMKVYNRNRWIYKAQSGLVCTQEMSLEALRQHILDNGDYSFLWQIVKSGNSYSLRNAAHGDYICAFSSTSNMNGINVLTTSNNSADAGTFTVTTNTTNNTFLFRSYYNWQYQYLNDNGQNLDYMSYWSGTDANSQFQLYPVELRNGAPKLRKKVVLQTIDNETSAVSDVTEIRRNDFIRVLVEVSYNPDKGGFQFEVHSWDDVKIDDDVIVFN